ncbi:MAG: nucleotidyltransferase family protein [Alistipes sp.]|nr:nucleotidyltransferase family protein [Alistipes sp.]
MQQDVKITADRLFALLRIALLDSDNEFHHFANIDNGEWEALYNLALSQGVHAIAYDAMRKLPEEYQADIDLKVQWAYNVNHAEERYKKQLAAAQIITNTFARHSIQTMIMKGLSVAYFYPISSHRQFGDIDIYLMGDFEQGNRVVREKGVKVKYDFFVHSEFAVKGVNVENHLYFVNPKVNATGEYIQKTLLELSKTTIPHPTVSGAFMPSAEFNALFLIRHSSWHYARECIRLRDICDWAMFLKANAEHLNTELVLKHLSASGLDRYAAILTDIANRYLGLCQTLPFKEYDHALTDRVVEDILTFDNPEKHNDIGTLRTFFWKIRNRIGRKWCYDKVVPDSFWGNITYSITGYIKNPFAIFKAKL